MSKKTTREPSFVYCVHSIRRKKYKNPVERNVRWLSMNKSYNECIKRTVMVNASRWEREMHAPK